MKRSKLNDQQKLRMLIEENVLMVMIVASARNKNILMGVYILIARSNMFLHKNILSMEKHKVK